ncbi:class I SAM-dependent methyltransferase [Paenibacillus lemnae]|uniref:Methyltransferase domain-containing protein n=1 Tax=Paenibacillus lemnae TaxID=1330551 RepID=A0A848M4W9_PAELE|nr:class I SAM-dependent methyltransferase [Paenibacillus lemnae]NMO95281.1 methyltransferase domain-containing protein [Paenibacillus lemnae]
MKSTHEWKPEEYDQNMAFVSGFGKGLIDWLSPQQGEYILDLGCGTGELADEISKSGAVVTGMDFSQEMVSHASKKFPHLHFFQGNGENFTTETSYDAVFSNAALHWMKDTKSAAASMYRCLKPGGRLIAEFGGQGNVEVIYQAARDILQEDYGINADKRNPWYFPSIGQYANLLEQTGFHVTKAVHYDRPTPLPEGILGIQHWLKHFGGMLFTGMEQQDQQEAFYKISERVKPLLWRNDTYYADYKRLRIAAVKR